MVLGTTEVEGAQPNRLWGQYEIAGGRIDSLKVIEALRLRAALIRLSACGVPCDRKPTPSF